MKVKEKKLQENQRRFHEIVLTQKPYNLFVAKDTNPFHAECSGLSYPVGMRAVCKKGSKREDKESSF